MFVYSKCNFELFESNYDVNMTLVSEIHVLFVFLVKGCKQDISCRKYIFPIRKKDVSHF